MMEVIGDSRRSLASNSHCRDKTIERSKGKATFEVGQESLGGANVAFC